MDSSLTFQTNWKIVLTTRRPPLYNRQGIVESGFYLPLFAASYTDPSYAACFVKLPVIVFVRNDRYSSQVMIFPSNIIMLTILDYKSYNGLAEAANAKA